MDGIKKYLKAFFIFLPLLYLSCDPVEEIIDDPYTMKMDEIEFFPKVPSMREPTKVVFHGCNYFKTFKVRVTYGSISVKKRFNSQLQWPCTMKPDTISLGYLFYGDYKVNFEIIDVNPTLTDSVFYSTTKDLTVILR